MITEPRYTYSLVFGPENGYRGSWYILDTSIEGWQWGNHKRAIVAEFPYNEDNSHDGRPPLVLRQKYEELLGRSEFEETREAPFNIVTLLADENDCGYDQVCAYGYRVETHAVYCHHTGWLYAPSKCKRGGDWPHAECPGYLANPLLENQVS